jgi:hypothetical protein
MVIGSGVGGDTTGTIGTFGAATGVSGLIGAGGVDPGLLLK